MYCTHCGTEVSSNANFCTACGIATSYKPKSVNELEGELKYLLPMATPITAVIAGYLGLFSILFLPAPFAIIFGCIGLHQIKKSDDLYGKGRCWTGIILGSACTLLAVALFLL
jgi:uncharacterized protein DUF4190/zinc ribbon protein